MPMDYVIFKIIISTIIGCLVAKMIGARMTFENIIGIMAGAILSQVILHPDKVQLLLRELSKLR